MVGRGQRCIGMITGGSQAARARQRIPRKGPRGKKIISTGARRSSRRAHASRVSDMWRGATRRLRGKLERSSCMAYNCMALPARGPNSSAESIRRAERARALWTAHAFDSAGDYARHEPGLLISHSVPGELGGREGVRRGAPLSRRWRVGVPPRPRRKRARVEQSDRAICQA